MIDLVAPVGVGGVVIEIVKGPSEVTVEFKLKEKAVSLWIYEDGAGIFSNTIDRRFEAPDFRDLTDLATSFSDSVAHILEEC